MRQTIAIFIIWKCVGFHCRAIDCFQLLFNSVFGHVCRDSITFDTLVYRNGFKYKIIAFGHIYHWSGDTGFRWQPMSAQDSQAERRLAFVSLNRLIWSNFIIFTAIWYLIDFESIYYKIQIIDIYIDSIEQWVRTECHDGWGRPTPIPSSWNLKRNFISINISVVREE